MNNPEQDQPFNEFDDADSWDIPYVEDKNAAVEAQKTNAFNMRSGWKYEPPEQEEEIKPPTAEEIEAIRAAAYEEGLAEGKQAGLEQGLAEGKEQGYTEGMTQGLEEGRAQGLAEGKEAAAQITQTFESMLEQIHEPLAQVNAEVKKQVTQLSVSLARAVLQVELQTNTEIVTTALQKGLEALPLNETQVQLHIHPEDLPLVHEIYSPEVMAEKGWTVVEKAGLARGGCEIISKNNAVDVSVERRTRDVIDKFLLSHGLNDESS